MEPHLTGELNGTELRYQLRGRPYLIALSTGGCAVTAGSCTLKASTPFGVNATGTGLEYFPGGNPAWALSVTPPPNQPLTVEIEVWPGHPAGPRRWTEAGLEKGKTGHAVAGLEPGAIYHLSVNHQAAVSLRADKTGRVEFVRAGHSAEPQQFELAP
jgi:hypothetical protein